MYSLSVITIIDKRKDLILMGYVLRGGRLPDNGGQQTILSSARNNDTPPLWPLSQPTPREVVLWHDLWAMPQSFLWHKEGLLPVVSLYVRKLSEAEKPDSHTTLIAAVSKLSDELYLSATSRLRARIVIVDEDPDDETPTPATKQATSTRRKATPPQKRTGTVDRVGEANDASGKRRSARDRFNVAPPEDPPF